MKANWIGMFDFEGKPKNMKKHFKAQKNFTEYRLSVLLKGIPGFCLTV
jgi:hypothetical protein